MHVYIYDTFISDKKYSSEAAKIETRITDLGLNGKIIRLGTVSSVYNAVENEVKKGAKTIVAVGDNRILSQTINAMARINASESIGSAIPLGFIPVGKKDNFLAEFLGTGMTEVACDVLSQRRIETLDLGQANDNYFLFTAAVSTEATTVEIDENYTIEIKEAGEIDVVNLPVGISLPPEAKTSPADGVLELIIKTKQGKRLLPMRGSGESSSVFSFNRLRISNQHHPVLIDGAQELKCPVDIRLAPVKINLIVGKDRKF